MSNWTRRDFVKVAAATTAGAVMCSRWAAAQSLKLPLGLQLYSVRSLLPSDYEGTLKSVAALGYREVEAAGYYGHSAAEVRQAMSAAGLRLVSAHYSSDDLHRDLDQILSLNRELGVRNLICSFPGFKNPERVQHLSGRARMDAFTLDDWRWNADQFNHIGEKVRAAGMKFGYHNHTLEFRETDGVIPYLELLRLTDPELVTMEMDCGWVIVGGGNPVELLKHYPRRISMLHVKDFKNVSAARAANTPPIASELGQGSIDYRPIFAEAARGGNIQHCFVEQEEFDMPPMQSLKIDAEYMRRFGAIT